MTEIVKNLTKIKALITAYEAKYHRPTGSVKLLAASKHQPDNKLIEAYQAGQRIYGENYLQEALLKMSLLPKSLEIEWHFIGRIQRNKANKIAVHFDWVQSVSSAEIAQRLNDHRPEHLPPLNICIEVNIDGEASKSGVDPVSVLSLAAYCQNLPRLNLRGLMCIPTPQTNFEKQRLSFNKMSCLKESLLQNDIAIDTLSMGMSNDFEAAIAEGSTLIRIGTDIFGPRSK